MADYQLSHKQRGTGRGFMATTTRQAQRKADARSRIEAVLRAGDVVDESGRATTKLLRAMGAGFGPMNLLKHLVAMEAEGLVTREVHGRLCTAIRWASRRGGRPPAPERVKVYEPTATRRNYRIVFHGDAITPRIERSCQSAESAERIAAEINEQLARR